MEEHSKLLIDLLSSAIRGLKPSSFISTRLDSNHLHNIWNDIYEEALAHEVHTLIYPILSELPSDLRPDNEIMIKWKRGTILSASDQIHHIEMVRMVLEKFHAEGIPVIALKGLVIRDYYPQPDLRTMGDADLLIKKEDIKKAKKLLREMGYVKGESCERHISFHNNNNATIELHNDSIHNQSDLRFTDTIWDYTMDVLLYDIPVLCLSIEYQILHIIFHSAHHVLSNGFGLRLLCDLVVYIEANQLSINWDMIMDCTKKFGIYKFTNEILHICQRLFQLQIPDLSYKFDEESNIYNELLINDILVGGVYGRRTYDREISGRFVKYINVDNAHKFANMQNMLKFLFPSIHKLDQRYKYAKKIPLLLPIAWIHRGFVNITRIKMLFLSKDSAVEATSKARSKLLHWLQLR